MNPNNDLNQEDLKAYVDGELEPTREKEIAQQLETNTELKVEVFYLREMTRMLKEEIEQAPVTGKERTLKALEPKGAAAAFFVKVGNRNNIFVWGGLAAALLLAFGLKNVAANGFGGDKVAHADTATTTPSVAMAKSADMASSKDSSLSDTAKSPLPEERAAGEWYKDGQARAKNSGGTSVGGFGDGASSFGGANGLQTGKSGSQSFARSASGLKDSATVTYGANSNGGVSLTTNRKIAQAAELTVGVHDVAADSNRATSIITGAGGAIQRDDVQVPADETSSPNVGESIPSLKATANIEADVPSDQLDTVIHSISALGKLRAKSIRASDVTDRIQAVEKERKAVQNQFDDDAAIAKNATSIKDKRRMKELQSMARQQLQDLEAQKKGLASMVATSHISLTMIQEAAENKNDTFSVATKSLGEFGNVILQFLIFAAVWTPVWLPIGLVLNYFSRKSGPK